MATKLEEVQVHHYGLRQKQNHREGPRPRPNPKKKSPRRRFVATTKWHKVMSNHLCDARVLEFHMDVAMGRSYAQLLNGKVNKD